MSKHIVTYNINAWMPVNTSMSYRMKISQVAAYIKRTYINASIINLQEVLPGKEGKHLKQIRDAFQEEGYEMIQPIFDVNVHWKSVLTITLIRKDILNSYTVEELSGDYLKNRITYTVADTSYGNLRILNCHVPQIANFRNKAAWYIKERIDIHNKMWDAIISEAEKYKDEKFIICGDMQEGVSGPHVSLLKALGYHEITKGMPTIYNNAFRSECIDHIFFSESAKEVFQPGEVLVDTMQVGVLSDHALLSTEISA